MFWEITWSIDLEKYRRIGFCIGVVYTRFSSERVVEVNGDKPHRGNLLLQPTLGPLPRQRVLVHHHGCCVKEYAPLVSQLLLVLAQGLPSPLGTQQVQANSPKEDYGF